MTSYLRKLKYVRKHIYTIQYHSVYAIGNIWPDLYIAVMLIKTSSQAMFTQLFCWEIREKCIFV